MYIIIFLYSFIVSRWFVATAAHCVQRARAKDIAVWLGALDTRAQAPPAERHKYIPFQKHIT